MTAYTFVKFDGVYTRGDTKIAINQSGRIRFSYEFLRRITNGLSFNYVVLFYDSANKAIAFKFTNTPESGMLKVTRDKKAGVIAARTFIKANNLDIKSFFGRYDWKKKTITNIGEVYIVELGKK